MRLTFTLFCLIALSYFANATRWTVSNSSARPAQFTQPQAAVDTAQAGDTIVIYTNINQYQDFTINKSGLVFIGEGYILIRTYKYALSNVFINSGANDIVFKDLSIVRLWLGRTCCTNFVVTNLEIDNCHIANISNSYASIDGFILTNSVINSSWQASRPLKNAIIRNNSLDNIAIPSGSENISIFNNIFEGESGFRDRISVSNSINITISNNIFIPAFSNYNNSYEAIELNSSPQLVLVSNNIFYKIRVSDNFPCLSCVYANNLTFENPDSITVLNNNIIEQDPQFVKVPSDIYDWRKYIFRLSDTSPAKSTASNGGDLGIYGGTNPTVFPKIYGKGSLPKVTRFFIQNQLVGKDGTLDVEIEATSSKYE